jgi:hypothetical protein
MLVTDPVNGAVVALVKLPLAVRVNAMAPVQVPYEIVVAPPMMKCAACVTVPEYPVFILKLPRVTLVFQVHP